MSSYSQSQMVHQNCQEETANSEHPLSGGNKLVSEDLSGELQGEPGEPLPAEPTDDAEARGDSWLIQGDFICRHQNEPRVQLYVPKEVTFAIPLKYIDVTRSTHTDLDVLQEKKIDDCWNVDSSKHMSDSWRGFTKFILLKKREGSKRTHVVREKTDKDSNDCQTRSCTARNMDENW